MGIDPELAALVHQTRKEAGELRRSSREVRRWTRELTTRARDLCARYQKLDAEEKALVGKETQAYRRIHSLRVEIQEQLRQSLSDLENTRMMSDDPEVRRLKEDIRESLEGVTSRADLRE